MDDERKAAVTFDDIAAELRALRAQRGETSFAEISRRISVDRSADGVSEAAATPPRSTVYHAFRDGRARMDAALIREIAIALGESEARADTLRDRCQSAHRARASTPAPMEPVTRSDEAPQQTSFEQPPNDDLTHAPDHDAASSARAFGRWGIILLLLACVSMNALGALLVAELSLGLFLDMIGTTVAAVALGPGYGVAVATTSHGLAAVAAGSTASLPFTLVNISGALVWGYGVRSFAMGRTFARYFSLSLIAGCICAAVAVPVVLALFHDGTGHAADGLAETFRALGLPTVAAVFAGTLMTAIPDALVSGFVALCALLFVHARWRSEHGAIPLLDQLCLLRRN
ncbi:hypothetical protein [Leucobacter tardus]|uniref:ECF transporter S component n=1 Tax=Leucobacter tardus TaxID=501483 RepID=A0A939TQY9_9MICO|nr:hypothetical protein [Leucobacter tardus]MBO2989487.1 hypothetical protein [Leucobacter tardus]